MSRSLVLRLTAVLAAAVVIPACGSSGGGGAPAVSTKHSSRGGRGTTGSGGDGGSISLFNEGGGDVVVSSSGSIAVNFTLPPLRTPYLGTNPYTVSGNVTMTTVAALTAKGQILRGATTNTFFGDDNASPATGLHILPGASLTIPAHYDNDNADADANVATGTFELMYIVLSDAIWIEGTLTLGKVDQAAQDDGLGNDSTPIENFTASSLVISPSGALLGRGRNVPGGLGGDGSSLDGSWNIPIVVNEGLIDISGGNGDSGGDAGSISIDLQGMWNTGSIINRGGDGANGNGGDGNSQHWDVDMGSAPGLGYFGGHNAGLIDCSGGNANNGDAGSAGDLELDPHDSLGSDICPGTFRARGGSVLSGDGNGGSGDDFGPDVGNGELVFTGVVDLSGGDGHGTGDGGNGAAFDCVMDSGSTLFSGDQIPGRVEVSAQILLGGGNGVNGGQAGDLTIGISVGTGYFGSAPGAYVVRYITSSLDSSGGDGDSGGTAGTIDISTDYSDDNSGNVFAGAIKVTVDLLARGGVGTGTTGGDGNTITLSTPIDNQPVYQRAIQATGRIDCSGGQGQVDGGFASTVNVTNRWSMTLGPIAANGGVGVTGTAGDGGTITLQCDEAITVQGSATAVGGGSSTGDGGFGGAILMECLRHVVVSGTVSASGGAGAATGIGGDAGTVTLLSHGGGTVVSSATSKGGSGGTPGADGTLIIDGIIIQP